MTYETALRKAAEAAMAPEPMGFPKNAPEYMDWQFKVASFEAECTPAAIIALFDTLAAERAARERAERRAEEVEAATDVLAKKYLTPDKAGMYRWPHDGAALALRIEAAEAALAAAQAEVARLREALTPSEATKYAYIGEFAFAFPAYNEKGEEVMYRPHVPWTTIKAIMEAIRVQAGLEMLPETSLQKAQRTDTPGDTP